MVTFLTSIFFAIFCVPFVGCEFIKASNSRTTSESVCVTNAQSSTLVSSLVVSAEFVVLNFPPFAKITWSMC